ncbi:MAG TPA: response regulator [Noviherbaspirillum sp.]|uniref:response regulator n=1 Tax=Noviherbaspirillum sp. TaxID=1926288 RepID=UPI002D26D14E|nr:response regulator [Noviherbaspirillum sp.]HYD96835.1 response regulator [Noviherbaspirillum sp.]
MHIQKKPGAMAPAQNAVLAAGSLLAGVSRLRAMAGGTGGSGGAGGTPAAQPQAEQAPPFAGRRILVADDNPVNQEVAVRLLEKLGCRCEVAANGVQAVALQTARPCELVLMDCEMPELDGFEATRRIRAFEGRRGVPIIALTASTGQGEREQCLAAGMDDFLSKPIRPQMLGDMLARWLPAAAPAAPADEPASCEDELEAIHEMFGPDFGELAALYRKDGPPRLAALRGACAAGDGAYAAKVAHAFGGSSASIGATGLCALCKELESRAKAGMLDGAEARLEAIEAEFHRICGKLQALLGS